MKEVVPVTDTYGNLIMDMYGKDSSKRKAIIIKTLKNPIVPKPELPNDEIGLEYIITQQVADYSVETLNRAIPNFIDGLKDS